MNEFLMIEKIPNIVKVTPEILSKVFKDKIGEVLDFNKTYGEQGVDDLDCVEIIMELEKILDISISDEVVDHFISQDIKPVLFTQYNRNKKIEELGI